MSGKNYLCFVIYGDDKTYYLGAKFCILSFLAHWTGKKETYPEVVVLAEQAHYFDDLPVKVMSITSEQKSDWSLNGQYHFRIKNRGLNYLANEIDLQPDDKLLFFDADVYFTESTNRFFANITQEQALMYFPEVAINTLPESNEYAVVQNKQFQLSSGVCHKIDDRSTMWASAVIGLTGNIVPAFDYADELILALREEGCVAHTVEQFALSEGLSQMVQLKPAKMWINHYSTSGRKAWGAKVLEAFFADRKEMSFDELISASKKISFKRPLHELIRGHIYKKKKKLMSLFIRR